MQVVTVSELIKKVGWKSRNSYYKYKNNGVFKNCYVDGTDQKKLYLEKSIKAISKAKVRLTHLDYKSKGKKSLSQKVKGTELDTTANNQELTNLLLDTDNAMQKVTITKDYWLGKINQQKFLKEEGELITVDSAKGAIEIMFTPLSRKLDDIHIDLKSRYPDIPLEAIEWLGNYVNDIKKSVSEHKWIEV